MKSLFFFTLLWVGLMTASCNSSSNNSDGHKGAHSGQVSGEAYQVDIPRSQLKWSAFKPTGTHQGIFPIQSGTVYVDQGLITGGTIVIDMSNLQVTDLEGEMKDKLEGHLRGTVPGKEDDFFNTPKYPTSTFTIRNSTKLENDPLGTHMINGDLKIKDISKPVSFKAKIDMGSGTALKATTEPFVIDRTLWDIKFQSRKFYDNLKDEFIHDEIKLEFTLGAVKTAQK